MRRRFLLSLAIVAALTLIILFGARLQSALLYQVPAETSDGWVTASLSDVGMDKKPIVELLRLLDQQEGHHVDGLLVVKNEKLVLETYYPGEEVTVTTNELSYVTKDFDRDTLHYMASASKSVTSVLFGIAVDKGYITDLDEKMFASFPEYAELSDAVKSEITLQQMLNMTTGMSFDVSTYPFSDKRNDMTQMFLNADPVRFMLGKGMIAMPGNEFNYNSGVTNLLGEILNRKTGIPLVQYADENLFDPLGITSYEWVTFPNAPQMAVTSSLLYLRPRDMAKIGQLYLQQGTWKGKQIVSAQWVQESTAKSVELSIEYSPVFQATGYGYQWWRGTFANTNTETIYAAGMGGQYIFIMPKIEMLVVLTGSNYSSDDTNVFDIVNRYILGSIYGYTSE